MNIQKVSCFLTIMLIFLQHYLLPSSSAIHLSPHKQKIALFHFKQSLTSTMYPAYCSYVSRDGNFYKTPAHPKTMNWSMSSDYCTWDGVSCDQNTGDVIGLDLSCSQLEGDILPNSTLFQLSHLQFLNLSDNVFFLSNQFPQEFGFFAKGLTHLNLSNTGISGNVPSGISHLYKLVSLDLSYNYATLEDEVFKSILQNLTQLRVLSLQWVNILRVPHEVFHLPNLEVLLLSVNSDNLTATLPAVKWGSSATLQHLSLSSTNIDGGLPDSIGFLESLIILDLYYCNLSGPIPRSIGRLAQLTYLALSKNDLNGPIPTFLANLKNLRTFLLFSNNLTGSLPRWLFHHTSLETLYLADNGFTGELNEFDSSKSQMQYFNCRTNSLNGPIPRSFSRLVNLSWVDFSSNNFSGPIPQSFSQLVNLTKLDFSSNNFSGVLDLEMFSGLEHLEYLDLSNNSLSVTSTSMTTLPPKLYHMGLSSCNMKEFPHFSRDAENLLDYVDLSNNKIEGEIPHWIGSVGGNEYYNQKYLNLSHNRLTDGLEQLPWNNIVYLDLQSNKLNGSLPTLICNASSLEILNLSYNILSGVLPLCPANLTSLSVVDLRMNKIQGNIPVTLSNFRNLETLNLNGNKLEGSIPSSFAEFDSLQVLDLGNNQINDTFPRCLEALQSLQVLVLKSNKFHGVINKSSKIEHPFPSLRIIDLSYNEFSGPLPAIYFINFKAMMDGEVNKIEHSYMEQLYYSDSTDLVIKGVEIVLARILTVYTTIDVSKNSFEGEIPEYIGNLVSLRFLNLSHNLLSGHIPPSIGKLTVLESLDLSSNQLDGEIPQQLTSVYSLAFLNLSCNQLRGPIPHGSQFNTFENSSYAGNFGLCGDPLSKKCEKYFGTQEVNEDDDYFFSGFTWEAVVIGYGCGVVPAFIVGYLMLLAGKPKWFVGIIARELGLKIRRMEIKWRDN